jgi:hypothetical protein
MIYEIYINQFGKDEFVKDHLKLRNKHFQFMKRFKIILKNPNTKELELYINDVDNFLKEVGDEG